MLLDKLIEFCGRREHAKAFQVKALEQYICYYFLHGLCAYVDEDEKIIGVAFARMIHTIDDLNFQWKPDQQVGKFLIIDSVVAYNNKAKNKLYKNLLRIMRNKKPEKIYMMRHGKWRELNNNILRRMKWEHE